MKTVLLVKTENNWADGMGLSGFVLFTPEKWQEHQVNAQKMFYKRNELTMCVGTNEEIYFKSLGDYNQQISVKKISSAQAQIYCQHFELEINDVGGKPNANYSTYGQCTLFDDDSFDYYLNSDE